MAWLCAEWGRAGWRGLSSGKQVAAALGATACGFGVLGLLGVLLLSLVMRGA